MIGGFWLRYFRSSGRVWRDGATLFPTRACRGPRFRMTGALRAVRIAKQVTDNRRRIGPESTKEPLQYVDPQNGSWLAKGAHPPPRDAVSFLGRADRETGISRLFSFRTCSLSSGPAAQVVPSGTAALPLGAGILDLHVCPSSLPATLEISSVPSPRGCLEGGHCAVRFVPNVKRVATRKGSCAGGPFGRWLLAAGSMFAGR